MGLESKAWTSRWILVKVEVYFVLYMSKSYNRTYQDTMSGIQNPTPSDGQNNQNTQRKIY